MAQVAEAAVATTRAPGGRKLTAVANLDSTARFSAVGVTWTRDPAVAGVHVQVRTHARGQWSDWTDMDALDTAPDDGSADVTGHPVRASSEPLWAGASDGVQTRVDVPEGAKAPADLKVELIDPGTSAADAHPGGRLPASSASAEAAMPAIITRAQWGADESMRPCFTGYVDTVKVGFVHHTDTSNNYGPGDSAAIVRSIYAYHVQSNGWCDIGYNYLVDRYGQIFEGRWGGIDRAVLGAHTGGFNTDSFAASLIGTFSTVSPPPVMLNALERLFAWKLSRYFRNPLGTATLIAAPFSESRYPTGTPVSFSVVSGHRDADLTTCPGDSAYALLGQIRQTTASMIPPPTLIGQRYFASGGAGGYLGDTITPEYRVGDSAGVDFRNASLLWSPSTGIHDVHGGIRDDYLATGGLGAFLGVAVSEESGTGDNVGRYSRFRNGAIYWTPNSGPHEVHGGIQAKWVALGAQAGFLRYPVTDEQGSSDGTGRFNSFENGAVYWTPATGAHEVHGAVRALWAAVGAERGYLGYPLSDEQGAQDGLGRFNTFQNGAVYWSAATGVHAVRGAIRSRWTAEGAQAGPLGYPVSDEYSVTGGARSDFQRGSITWDAVTGATSVIPTKP